jgi:hypothetical protein
VLIVIAARGTAQTTAGAGRRRCNQFARGVIREERLMTTVHPGHPCHQLSGICEAVEGLYACRIKEITRVGSPDKWIPQLLMLYLQVQCAYFKSKAIPVTGRGGL